MTSGYLSHEVDPDSGLTAVIDELPLWSAPFGLKLLETIRLSRQMRVLDAGCGPGFPLIEIAQRLGTSSITYGLDPWFQALERASLKCRVNQIDHVGLIQGIGESMPFRDESFHLIVSNNGITNAQDLEKTLRECSRVCKPGAQMVIAYNLEGTMVEFYTVFQQSLEALRLYEIIEKMHEHIHQKRIPAAEMTACLYAAGFAVDHRSDDAFYLRFLDALSFFNHSLIKFWFLSSWKRIIPENHRVRVFADIENRLNQLASNEGEIRLSIPFVILDCRKTSKTIDGLC